MHVIYLHGFCSSIQSLKAQQVKQYIDNHRNHSLFLVDLPHAPREAMRLLDAHISTLGDAHWGLVGSSLGGYYATYLSEKYQVNAVLINPAVRAYSLLEAALGDNKNYHSDEVFALTVEHLTQLRELYVPTITSPQKLLLLTQTGDEVLNYQEGIEYYHQAKQVVIAGGNHGFDNYKNYLNQTFTHLMG